MLMVPAGCPVMKRLLVLLVVLGAVLGSSRTLSAQESAGELARYCQVLDKGTVGRGQRVRIPQTKEALLCWGYMQAIQDLSMLVDPDGQRLVGFCPPKDSRLTDLIRTFLTYMRAHRDEADHNTLVTVVGALQEAYPCERAGAAKP